MLKSAFWHQSFTTLRSTTGCLMNRRSSSGTASNAAGVITYCMKNNYLNADKAAQVKNQLLGKMGLGQKEEPKDEGYLSGLSGMVTGSGGKSFSLDKIKGDLKEKACDYVLDNAKSLL